MGGRRIQNWKEKQGHKRDEIQITTKRDATAVNHSGADMRTLPCLYQKLASD